MERQLPPLNGLLLTRESNQALCQRAGFSLRHHPADDIATEDIENHS
jgi:hypothetical protein